MPAFPSDIKNLDPWMSFQFARYSREINGAPNMTPMGSVYVLPMPEKINDRPSAEWASHSFQEDILTKGLALLKAGGSYITGQIPNPMLVMLYKSPQFREFTFSWNLAPRNSGESDSLDQILKDFRKYMLPQNGVQAANMNATLMYPYVVQPTFSPNTQGKLFKFTWCAILNIDIDYTGAGMPAFFKGGSGPAQVRFRIHLRELDYLTQQSPEVM